MNTVSLALAVQATWLVLCGMMLFSRFIFQAAGPVWMRAFLDGWKFSVTHRVWGIAAFIYGAALLIGGVRVWVHFDWVDRTLVSLLAAVLCGDGLLNLVPSWFGHFKERMQDAWVRRHRGTERVGDKQLFGTVNFFLGLASTVVAALVYWHRPIPVVWVGGSVVVAIVLMGLLIFASRAEVQRSSQHVV